MFDATSLQLLLALLAGWLDQRQQAAVAYLIEENRILRGHVRGRIRLTDEERRRLARSKPSITTASGIIKAWTTHSSMTTRTGRRGTGFAVGRGSVGCSITTNEPLEGYG